MWCIILFGNFFWMYWKDSSLENNLGKDKEMER